MWTHPKKSLLLSLTSTSIPERDRAETLAKAAQSKLKRDRDASEAMKDIEAERQSTLAKTARLRAERLAREASAKEDSAKAAKAPKSAKKK